MPRINPEWQKAEDSRLAAEKKYKDFMASQEALTMREDDSEGYRDRIAALNAEIEAANKKVRLTRQHV